MLALFYISLSFVLLQWVIRPSSYLWSKNAIKNQYTAIKPYRWFYMKIMIIATMIVKGTSNSKYIFLNSKNISFKSTFYKCIISLSGIRSLHYLAILSDLETNLRAKVDYTLIASSWNSLFECSAKNNLNVWMIINL